MALTKITPDIIKDSSITAANLAATGTASSATTLFGNDTWAAVSSSGVLNMAAADPGTGQTAGNTWFLTGIINYVTNLATVGGGVWSTGGEMLETRDYTKGCGSSGAAIVCGKEYSNVTDELIGGTWSAGGNMLFTGAYQMQGGLQSAAWMAGGRAEGSGTNRTDAALYDGTSWSATGSLNTGVWLGQGFGLQSAGVACGGNDGNFSDTTEEFDGTSWSAVNNMLSNRGEGVATGILTAGLTCGGEAAPGGLTSSEEYDGTCWTAGGSVPITGSGNKGQGGTGLQTAALMWGGAPYLTTTSEYDGSSWSSVGNLNIGRQSLSAGAGSVSAGIAAGGRGTGSVKLQSTEEWNKVTIQFIGV